MTAFAFATAFPGLLVWSSRHGVAWASDLPLPKLDVQWEDKGGTG